MLQYTYLPNGDTQVTCGTSDELLKELTNQFSNEMTYVPYSFVSRSVMNPTTRLSVRHVSSNPTKVNPACDVFEISPITRKIIARDSESFFACLTQQFEQGFRYSAGSANLTYGSYSAVVTNAAEGSEEPVEVVDEAIETFDLDTALSIQTKEELVEYCERFGIKVDARKSLTKIYNWLQAQSQQ